MLATQYGAHAVRLIDEGKLGEMICYHPPHMKSVPIRDAVHRIREVDGAGRRGAGRPALGISFADGAEDASPFQCERADVEDLAAPIAGSEHTLHRAECAGPRRSPSNERNTVAESLRDSNTVDESLRLKASLGETGLLQNFAGRRTARRATCCQTAWHAGLVMRRPVFACLLNPAFNSSS